jgi:hypothetical protein
VSNPPAIGSPFDHDDRYCGRSSSERLDEIVEIYNDRIRIAADDLGSKCDKALGAALGRIALDDKVPSFNIAEPAQRLVESPHPERAGGLGELIGGNPGMNERDAVLLRRLLRALPSATQPRRR